MGNTPQFIAHLSNQECRDTRPRVSAKTIPSRTDTPGGVSLRGYMIGIQNFKQGDKSEFELQNLTIPGGAGTQRLSYAIVRKCPQALPAR